MGAVRTPGAGTRPSRRRLRTLGRAGAAGLAAASLVFLAACDLEGPGSGGGGGGGYGAGVPASSAPASATSEAPPSSAAPSPTPAPTGGTATAAPTDAPPAGQAAFFVFPGPDEGSFSGPRDVVEAFATDFVGFEDPLVGEFRQGDNRSGEVEVRAEADGPATTVLVRRSDDGMWHVVGATTPEIQVDEPQAGAEVGTPLRVSGEAVAFEGHVLVQVRGDDGGVLGEEPVIGSGGPDPGPFSGDIDFDDPGDGRGAVLFLIHSARDGSVWQAAVLPVAFGA